MDASIPTTKAGQSAQVDAPNGADSQGQRRDFSLEEAFEFFELIRPYSASLKDKSPVVKVLKEIQQRNPTDILRLLQLARGDEDLTSIAVQAIDDSLSLSLETLSFLDSTQMAELVELGFTLGVLE